MDRPALHRRRILFVAEAVTLSHVARPRVLAGALDPARFDVHFAVDSRADWVAAGLNARRWPISSIPPETFLGHLASGRPVYSAATLAKYVEEDLELIRQVKPDLIVGDFRLSLSTSARLAGVPYAAIANIHWSRYARVRFPAPDIPVCRLVPVKVANALFNVARPLPFAVHARPANIVRRRYGLPPLSHDLRDVYTDGDFTLYADPEGWIPTDPLPASHRYLGPIYWSPETPPDPALQSLPTDRPVVSATLGSSGRIEALKPLIRALGRRDLTAVIATAGRTDLKDLPVNVITVPFLPGVAGLPRVDVAVTNGGSGSTPQALRAGVPVLGITSLMDQDIPMQAAVNRGAGLRLPVRAATESAIGDALDRLLTHPRFKEGAGRLAGLFQISAEDRFRSFVESALCRRAGGRGR